MFRFSRECLLLRFLLGTLFFIGDISTAEANRSAICREGIFDDRSSLRVTDDLSSEDALEEEEREIWEKMIRELETLPADIERLSFSQAGLTDVLLESLASSFPEKFCKLLVLDLSFNKLLKPRAEDLLSLARKCPALETIVLSGNPGFGGNLLSGNLTQIRAGEGGDSLINKLIVFERTFFYRGEDFCPPERELLGEGWSLHHQEFYAEFSLKRGNETFVEGEESIFTLEPDTDELRVKEEERSTPECSLLSTPGQETPSLVQELEELLKGLTDRSKYLRDLEKKPRRKSKPIFRASSNASEKSASDEESTPSSLRKRGPWSLTQEIERDGKPSSLEEIPSHLLPSSDVKDLFQ